MSSAASRRAVFKALAIDPEHGHAQNFLLIGDWLSGKLNEITDEYYKCEAEFGDDPGYVFYRGYSAMAFGQTQSAIHYLEKALTLDPLRGYTLYDLGVLYVSLGDFEQARDYTERARAIGFGSQYSVELRLRPFWTLFAKALWGGDETTKSQIVSFITQTLAQFEDDINQGVISSRVNLGEPELFLEAYDRVGISNFQVFAGL